MKDRFLIAVLITIFISIPMYLVIQSVQYDMTISQFEKQCQNLRESRNDSSIMCVWPGGPPEKPILHISELGEKENGD